MDNGDTLHSRCDRRIWPAIHCVFTFAAARGGLATETNWVACSTPVPTGVGNENRNGTSTRVPEIGASHTSASRKAARYLIASAPGCNRKPA